jgi:hypothetical protein
MTNAAKKAAKAELLAALGKEMPPFARDLAMAMAPAIQLEKEPSSEKTLVMDLRRALKLAVM